MSKIIIIGAHGAIARIVTERLLSETDDKLVLYLRSADRLSQYQENPRVTMVDGNVLDTQKLAESMKDVDIVYSNAGGTDLADQTASILKAMNQTGKKRLIFISALGARHEVAGKFGQWNEQAISAFLPGFRDSAKFVDESNIDFTEVRPAWLTDNSGIKYETTSKDESFYGTEVSRASVADFVIKVIADPTQYVRASVGLDKPGTDGDKPSWI